MHVAYKTSRNDFYTTNWCQNSPLLKHVPAFCYCCLYRARAWFYQMADPADLSGLWFRSARAGLVPIDIFFSIMLMKFSIGKPNEHFSPCLWVLCSPLPTGYLLKMSLFCIHFSLECCRWSRVPQLDDVWSPCWFHIAYRFILGPVVCFMNHSPVLWKSPVPWWWLTNKSKNKIWWMGWIWRMSMHL